MNDTFFKINIAIETTNPNPYLFIRMTVFGFLFGILTEWKSLLSIIQRRITINWFLLVPAVILLCACLIPRPNWVIWFGLGQPFYIDMLWKPEIHMILTVFSGILLARSLAEK